MQTNKKTFQQTTFWNVLCYVCGILVLWLGDFGGDRESIQKSKRIDANRFQGDLSSPSQSELPEGSTLVATIRLIRYAMN